MSRNDLDIKYLHTFINWNICLYLPTSMSQATIVPEKNLLFSLFDKPKLQNLPCGKIGQGQPKVIT